MLANKAFSHFRIQRIERMIWKKSLTLILLGLEIPNDVKDLLKGRSERGQSWIELSKSSLSGSDFKIINLWMSGSWPNAASGKRNNIILYRVILVWRNANENFRQISVLYTHWY